MKISRLYKVTFNKYTNYCEDTISTNEEGLSGTKYINIPDGGLIIREDEFNYYRCFGDGIKTMTFIGSMIENEK